MEFLKGSASDAKEFLRSVATDLLNLEINTIIKKKMMTARKAPSPPHVLLDIAGQYEDQMKDPPDEDGFGMRVLVAKKQAEEEGGDWIWKAGDPGRPTVSSQSFHNLYVTARYKVEASFDTSVGFRKDTPTPRLNDSQKTILDRIRKSSVEIADILKRLEDSQEEGWAVGMTRSQVNVAARDEANLGKPGVALTDQEWMRIRKIWEIGVEEVVMQTVIQLDGDVVTRINRTFAGPAHAHLWKAHLDGTKVAMDSWHFLVDTVGRFLSAAVGFFKK
jgi:hypothetical protein